MRVVRNSAIVVFGGEVLGIPRWMGEDKGRVESSRHAQVRDDVWRSVAD